MSEEVTHSPTFSDINSGMYDSYNVSAVGKLLVETIRRKHGHGYNTHASEARRDAVEVLKSHAPFRNVPIILSDGLSTNYNQVISSVYDVYENFRLVYLESDLLVMRGHFIKDSALEVLAEKLGCSDQLDALKAARDEDIRTFRKDQSKRMLEMQDPVHFLNSLGAYLGKSRFSSIREEFYDEKNLDYVDSMRRTTFIFHWRRASEVIEVEDQKKVFLEVDFANWMIDRYGAEMGPELVTKFHEMTTLEKQRGETTISSNTEELVLKKEVKWFTNLLEYGFRQAGKPPSEFLSPSSPGAPSIRSISARSAPKRSASYDWPKSAWPEDIEKLCDWFKAQDPNNTQWFDRPAPIREKRHPSLNEDGSIPSYTEALQRLYPIATRAREQLAKIGVSGQGEGQNSPS